jgi:rhodanese-related sulfurtransferase
MNVKTRIAAGRALLVVLLSFVLFACTPKPDGSDARYITWDGLEPDLWASVWLIKRYIDPKAEIVLRPVGAPTDGGIAFGVADAKYKRSHGLSIYESLRRGFVINDPALQELGQVILDIEIAPWAGKTSEYSVAVELAYRQLQDTFEARVVPVDCYGRFFDEVYRLLSRPTQESDWRQLGSLGQDPACRSESTTLARRDLTPFVRRLDTDIVLDSISKNKKVVFVDTREAAEFEEFHIPGAINLQLREVGPGLKARFEDADLVIPYCIKDFRGFEMARSLAEIGVHNVGIMQPYGIAGWQHLGLPVVRRDGLSESEALDKLAQCAQTGNCIANRS